MTESIRGKTAYAAAERELAGQVRHVRVDFEAMAIPLRRCELSSCRATCCHDGVILGPDEMSVMERTLDEQAEVFRSYDWERTHLFSRRNGQWKSLSVPAASGQLAADFPSRFPRTRCVFLDAQHRCVWQRLSTDAGRAPWYWKPISCWMHPLRIRTEGEGNFVLTLHRPGEPGFEAETPCGAAMAVAEGGEPAWKVLEDELKWLGEIGGRDLLGEIGDAMGSRE